MLSIFWKSFEYFGFFSSIFGRKCQFDISNSRYQSLCTSLKKKGFMCKISDLVLALTMNLSLTISTMYRLSMRLTMRFCNRLGMKLSTRNLMVTFTLKLCLTVSRGGMVYEKPFKDILWSLIFRNCPNYVTKLQFFSDGWNLFFSNQEFNAVIEPEVVSCS